jgi:hypothetical protein
MNRSPRAVRFLFALALAALGLINARDALAQQGYLYIKIDNQFPYACQTSISTPGIHIAHVWVAAAYPLTAVRFSAVVPTGTTYLGDSPVLGSIASGNSQSGVEVVFPCKSSSYEVMQVLFLTSAPVPTFTWEITPRSGESAIGLTDCDGFVMKGSGLFSPYCDAGSILGPYKPFPPDGATDVPLDVILNWTGSANEIGVADHPMQWPNEGNVHYCAQNPPPLPCTKPLDPGTLLPNTTYYWRALNICCCCEHGDYAAGDVWSFTTGDAPLSATKATWGQVKAMYRE